MAQYNSTHTGQEIDNGVSKALNPDATPTSGSNNLVKSGGVYDALAAAKEYVDEKVELMSILFPTAESGQYMIDESQFSSIIRLSSDTTPTTVTIQNELGDDFDGESVIIENLTGGALTVQVDNNGYINGVAGGTITLSNDYDIVTLTNVQGSWNVRAIYNPYASNPAMNGSASPGTSAQFARGDHVHPSDTSKADAEDVADIAEDVDDLKSALDDITVPSPYFSNMEPLFTVNGKYVYNGTNDNKLRLVTDNSMSYNVYKLSAGEYKIHGFGYDRYQFYLGVMGDNPTVIAEGNIPISNFIQNIECGGSEYPSDYTYHTVVTEIANDGYLFVNYKTNQSEGYCQEHKRIPVMTPILAETAGIHGIIKNDNMIYHFTNYKGCYLVRKFTNTNANNLFQWSGLALANIVDGEIEIIENIIDFSTDIIGPISIFNSTLFPGLWGMWAGGNHTVNVADVACPTARQDSIRVLINDSEITNDGIYYGNVKFVVKNSIYFPQSIEDQAFTNAVKALEETREYNLDSQMRVRVTLDFKETTRVTLYYGMQAVNTPYNSIFLVNNELFHTFPIDSEIVAREKEHEIIATAQNGMRLIMRLNNIGLGTFKQNDGSTGYATIPPSSYASKTYYRLIEKSRAPTFNSGDHVAWEGDYIIDSVM